MPVNPHTPYSPEYRTWLLAQDHDGPALSDDELLTQAGYVPHDGTMLAAELVAQYHAERGEATERFIDGVKLHAHDWAFNGMRSDYETAQAYGEHMASLCRAGELTAETSHRAEYPAFLAARETEPAYEREPEDEPEIEDFDPGPECDDIGGMSEVPYFIQEPGYELEA